MQAPNIKNPWLLFFGVVVGPFMVGIDSLAMGIAIEPMAKTLALNISTLQWFLSAFAIGQACSLVTAGKLADILGKKNATILGLILFILSSSIISVSSSPLVIIIARLLQGISGGIMAVVALAILVDLYPADFRTIWIARLITINGVGMVLGPIVGGLIALNFSWRMVFLINLPIGATGLLLALKYVPKSLNRLSKQKIDFLGILFLTTFLFLLTTFFSQSHLWGMQSLKTISVIIASCISFICFIICEKKYRDFALLDFKLFKATNFIPANLSGFTAYFCCMSWILIYGTYLQNVLHLTPFQAGFWISINGIGIALIAPKAGKLIRQYGAKKIILLGEILAVVAFAGMLFIKAGTTMSIFLLSLFFLFGVSFAIINSSSIYAALEFTPKTAAGAASGISLMIRWLGATFGAAISATVFSLGVAAAKAGYLKKYLALDITNPDLVGLNSSLFMLCLISLATYIIAKIWLRTQTPKT